MRRPCPPLILPAITAVAVPLLVAGCSSDDQEFSSWCAEKAALETSLSNLSELEPAQDGLDAVESTVADTKADLESMAIAADDLVKPLVEKVQTAFDDLESALQGVTSSNLAESATQIGDALSAVGSAAADLQDTLNQDCPDS